MTSKNVFQAMNNLDSTLIMAAAPAFDHAKQPKIKRPWRKWASIAACLALVIGLGTIMLPLLSNLEENGNQEDVAYAVWIGDFLYDPISVGDDICFPEVRALAVGDTSELKYDIREEHLGAYIDSFSGSEKYHIPAGKAYHFAAYPDYDAVIIVEQNGKYHFFISHGGPTREEMMDSSAVMELYHLPESCTSLLIEYETKVTDRAVIERLFSIIADKKAVSPDTINRIQWEGWCEENGTDSVFFDGKDLSFRDSTVHQLYNDYLSINYHIVWYDTDRGFHEQLLHIDTRHQYVTLCTNHYLLSDAETAELISLLNLQAE